ncbi:hypothetical protein [Adlercreutzia murintestinalis]|jgi:hypothetical protein|uniref:hypothetical protein n=1 Tax=Adlercreutzia murintestinalis TaxID=2941325 RepID=UPI002040CC41|nr:hypothetical protein [Adlercreutzia murintestinalis]
MPGKKPDMGIGTDFAWNLLNVSDFETSVDLVEFEESLEESGFIEYCSEHLDCNQGELAGGTLHDCLRMWVYCCECAKEAPLPFPADFENVADGMGFDGFLSSYREGVPLEDICA